jgi:hypothetical protein
MRLLRFALLLLVIPQHSYAQAVRVTGTSVELEPPPGFVAASRYPGFERADVQCSIMVTEIPGPFADLARGMTAPNLATRGMTLLSTTKPIVDGRQVLLLKVSQQAAGAAMLKWMVVAGDAKSSVMIVGTFPAAHDVDVGNAVKASLLSARWNAAAAAPDPFEGLPFRVTSTPVLKVAGRMSNLLLLSESGQITQKDPNAALFAIGSSVAPVDLGDLKAFSHQRARQTKQITAIQVAQEGATTIDGIAGYEILAEAKDVASGRGVSLYQVILPVNDGYVLMQGLVAPSRAAMMMPEFRKVAETFRRTAR